MKPLLTFTFLMLVIIAGSLAPIPAQATGTFYLGPVHGPYTGTTISSPWNFDVSGDIEYNDPVTGVMFYVAPTSIYAFFGKVWDSTNSPTSINTYGTRGYWCLNTDAESCYELADVIDTGSVSELYPADSAGCEIHVEFNFSTGAPSGSSYDVSYQLIYDGTEPTETPTPGPCEDATDTPTPTLTPSNTPTPTYTFTPSNTPTPTYTFTPSNTPTITPSFTPRNTFTPSNTPTPSRTPTPSNTPLATTTATLTPSQTPTPTRTFTPRPPTATQRAWPTRTPFASGDPPSIPTYNSPPNPTSTPGGCVGLCAPGGGTGDPEDFIGNINVLALAVYIAETGVQLYNYINQSHAIDAILGIALFFVVIWGISTIIHRLQD